MVDVALEIWLDYMSAFSHFLFFATRRDEIHRLQLSHTFLFFCPCFFSLGCVTIFSLIRYWRLLLSIQYTQSFNQSKSNTPINVEIIICLLPNSIPDMTASW